MMVSVSSSDVVRVKMMVSVIGMKSLFFSFCSVSRGMNMMMMMSMFEVIGFRIL